MKIRTSLVVGIQLFNRKEGGGVMETLNQWQKERKSFLMKVISFTFLFFLTLPISIELFPTFMNQPVIGWMTFAWLFGFAQIIVTWLLGWMYWKKAKRLDALLNEAVRELDVMKLILFILSFLFVLLFVL